MRRVFREFAKDQSGAAAIEYGLIAGLICVAMIAAATTLGAEIAAMFGRVQAQVSKVLAS